MSEVEETPEELMESETAEPREEVEDVGDEDTVKSGASSPTELRVLVDVIDMVRRVLRGEASEEELRSVYEKLYGKT